MAREDSYAGAERSGRTIKSPSAFRTISEVAGEIDVPQHVLRFWETKFNQVKPLKRAGGRRYYRPEDVALLGRIRSLLYEEGYTIKGVQKLLRSGGVRALEGGGAAGDQAELAEDEADSGAAAGPEGRASAPAADEAMPAAAAPAARAAAALPDDVEAELRSLRRELGMLRDQLRGKRSG
ncbi:MAG: MerR family transcriptional regulator [Alphaproteobacteria bacterium]